MYLEDVMAEQPQATAKALVDRLTRKEISIEEFLRLAETLSNRELELLSELLRQRRIQAGRLGT